MIRAGAGVSAEPNTERAAINSARGATAQLQETAGAALAFVFCTSGHLPRIERLLQVVREETGAPQVVGCTGYGVLGRGCEIEAAPGVVTVALSGPGLRVSSFLEEDLRGRDAQVASALARTLRPCLPGPGTQDGALLVLLPDAFNLRADTLLQTLDREFGAGSDGQPAIAGGVAAEDGGHQRTYLFHNDRIETNAVAGALLSGPFTVDTHLTQSCRPIGPLRTVTRARGNLLFEIDGRPAFEVFAEVARPPLLEDLQRAISCVFVGLPIDPDAGHLARGGYLVRALTGIDASAGVLASGEPLLEGQRFGFVLRDAGGAREDLKEMLEEAGRSLSSRSLAPRLGLYFNCCARGRSLYGHPNIDSAYMQSQFRDLPLAGFFGNGEIARRGGRTRLHGYSGVLALISEGAA